jgi:hypothetical protein
MHRAREDELLRWRELDACSVLPRISTYAAFDPTFVPVKNSASRRWNVVVAGKHFELVVTGAKFFDTRRRCGGCGAVDLVMHVHSVAFGTAVALLRESGL